jgi:Na+/H+ antiporter NhaD/arsenite permease-like protein
MNGATLSLWWTIPFAGLLLSIALMPLFTPTFWHHHFGKVALGWALLVIVPGFLLMDASLMSHVLVDTLVGEYFPFIILLLALFTVAGGIVVRGNLHGSPLVNTGILGTGTLLASVMGTTGASMLLIRPLIRANDNRRHNVHVVIFFIFLVSNIGGALTPLGDPPLFLGFLKGVDFFWTTRHLLAPTIFMCVCLFIIFYLLDRWFYARESAEIKQVADPTPDSRLRLVGGFNLFLLAIILGLVLMSGTWKPGISVGVLGVELQLQNIVRDIALIAVTIVSWVATSRKIRDENAYTWGPILEVAKLFAGIFVTIIPVIAILRAGRDGELASLVAMVTAADGTPINAMYFWMTGVLSSFLDNAPTYLVFFNLAGGDASVLMTTLQNTLVAISCGAVFMGANTYIGNAPNFMVKAIAEDRGVKMPSFFGYMLWSGVVLIPLFIIMTLLFF